MCVPSNNPLVTSFYWFIWSAEPLLSSISFCCCYCCSFAKSFMSDNLWPHEPQHTRLPCPSPSPWISSDLCLLSQWCHPAVSSSVSRFSSCCQLFPASESFPVSQLFTSGGQSIGASVSASVLPVNIQGWFPLGWTSLISLRFESGNSSVLSLPYGPTLTSIHDYFYSPSFINMIILNIFSTYI